MLPVASLFVVNLNHFEPADASIACQTGTAKNHSNGSLAGCILSSDSTFQVGANSFSCTRGEVITFNIQGQFNSCILKEKMTIRRAGQISDCPIGSMATLTIKGNNNDEIGCVIATAARSAKSGASCECPYDTDATGSRCGNRSAWSRPRGQKPMCYVRSV